MPIQIGQPPGHDFDEPLGLLSDCHRRIEHFLHVLAVVDAEAAGGPLTLTHRSALEASLRYFAIAAPKHTADEEESLFPRLRGSSDPAAVAAMTLVDRLEHDHDEATPTTPPSVCLCSVGSRRTVCRLPTPRSCVSAWPS